MLVYCGDSLTATGIPVLPHQLDEFLLNDCAGLTGVRCQRIGIQLQGVGPGLFDLLGEAHPASRGGAVQAGQHGNAARALGALNLAKVSILPLPVVLVFGEIAQRLGKRFRAAIEVAVQGIALQGELLLED